MDGNGEWKAEAEENTDSTVKAVLDHIKELFVKGTLLQAIIILLRHAVALYGLSRCLRGFVSFRMYVFSVLLWPISGLGVTAGAHRRWSHRSYDTTAPMEFLLILLYAMADQGPITGWALTHAVHHWASETPGDPHNRAEGFIHAHWGWLFSTRRFSLPGDQVDKVLNGLGPLVRFHDSIYVFFDPMMSMGLPALIGSLWGEAWDGFLVAGALRWCVVQHITFFVNSVAHGEREVGDERSLDPLEDGIGPRVSLLVTVLALGEGWHDYHHRFPWDYAAAELDSWDQWNPTKAFIDLCAYFGLVKTRRRCSARVQEQYRVRLHYWHGDGPVQGQEAPRFRVVGAPFMRYKVMDEIARPPAPPPPPVSIEGSKLASL